MNNVRPSFAMVSIVLLFQSLLWPLSSCQAQTAQRISYGMNASGFGYYAATDGGYVDVLRKAAPWNAGSLTLAPLTANGYPTADPAGATWQGSSSFFTVLGYGPGIVRFNFYGEGIFDLGVGGNYVDNASYPNNGIVPGTLQKTVNSNGIAVTTCQVEFNIPQPVLGGYALAQSIPLSWITLTKVNPNQDPNGSPNNFHLTCPGYATGPNAGSNPVFTKEYVQTLVAI